MGTNDDFDHRKDDEEHPGFISGWLRNDVI